MLEDKSTFIDSKEVFQSVIDGYSNGYLVAHNHFFDMRVLGNNGINVKNHNWLCTWRMAKKLFADIDSIEETNLPYLRFALDLNVPLEMLCHRAGNDSYITAKLLEIMIDLIEENNIIDTSKSYGPQILEWINKPIIYTKMPFGKYKGELMTDVPKSYWRWALTNMDSLNEKADNFDLDFAASVHRALGLDE